MYFEVLKLLYKVRSVHSPLRIANLARETSSLGSPIHMVTPGLLAPTQTNLRDSVEVSSLFSTNNPL